MSRLAYWRERYERLPLTAYEERYEICLSAARRALTEHDLQAATHWLGMAQVQISSLRDRQNVVGGKRKVR